MKHSLIIKKVLSWIFGLLFFAIGVINTFWGDPAGFGIFIMLLSLCFLLPVNDIAEKLNDFLRPRMGLVKVILALFVLWASLGVGKLFDKVERMLLYLG